MIIIICKEANKVGIFQSNSRATGSSSSTAAFLGPNPSSSSSSSSSSESTFFSMLYCEKVLEIFLKLQEEPIEYWGGGYLVCSHLLSASLRSFHGIKYNRHTVLSKFGRRVFQRNCNFFSCCKQYFASPEAAKLIH